MSPDPEPEAALPDHVRRNRAEWDEWATEYVANGERSWRLGSGRRPTASTRSSSAAGPGTSRHGANDFEVEDLIELQAPQGATTSYPFVTADWAHRWPSEEVWKARKRG